MDRMDPAELERRLLEEVARLMELQTALEERVEALRRTQLDLWRVMAAPDGSPPS